MVWKDSRNESIMIADLHYILPHYVLHSNWYILCPFQQRLHCVIFVSKMQRMALLQTTSIHQGAFSIRKTVLPGMGIPMLKIRRPVGRLIFNMGITIPSKTVFLIETAPSIPKSSLRGLANRSYHQYVMSSSAPFHGQPFANKWNLVPGAVLKISVNWIVTECKWATHTYIYTQRNISKIC